MSLKMVELHNQNQNQILNQSKLSMDEKAAAAAGTDINQLHNNHNHVTMNVIAPPPSKPLGPELLFPPAREPDESLAAYSRRLFQHQDVPRKVYTRFRIADITKVDAQSKLVHIDFHVYLRWFDPAMIGIGHPEFGRTPAEYNALWNPRVEINKEVDLEPQWDDNTSWNFKDSETGEMKYSQRYRGTLSNDMDLHNFPFDSDDIEITIGSELFSSAKLQFVAEPNFDHTKSGAKCSLVEWSMRNIVYVSTSCVSNSVGKGFSHITASVSIARNYAFYMWKIVFINCLVAAWSWSVFWMDPTVLPDRMSTTLTLFLASVAFMFVTNDKLPRVPYLTILDRIILVFFAFVFFTAVESFAVYYISNDRYGGSMELAEQIDLWSNLVFPVCLVVIIGCLIVHGVHAQRRTWNNGELVDQSQYQ
jgi:Neurotransmitter-gated ion-channel ligand binding domain